MARIDLKIYYRNLFKEYSCSIEQLKQINAAHVISSDFYDIQFGRNTIIYRDINNKLNIPIEHEIDHNIVIYLKYYYENNCCKVPIELLKSRLSKGLDFLKTKYLFE